jgi:tetrahydromethanopterin S-methyltransferase subunit G
MNEQILFDRLRYIDKLKGAGIGENHARAHAEAFDSALREAVATKSDIAALKNDIAKIDAKIDLAVRDVTIRLGGLIAVGVGILAAVKFFG